MMDHMRYCHACDVYHHDRETCPDLVVTWPEPIAAEKVCTLLHVVPVNDPERDELCCQCGRVHSSAEPCRQVA